MKRVLSIVLILLALSNIVGFMPLYFSLLQEIKSEACLAMAKGTDLQHIRVTNNEYHNPAVFNITDEHEFRYNGRCYDFKEVKNENGDFIFYALSDNKESGLVDFLTTMFGQQDNSGKNTNSPICNLLKNFSKDFIGSFSFSLVLVPKHYVACFFPGSFYTCPGYSRMLLAPPDTSC